MSISRIEPRDLRWRIEASRMKPSDTVPPAIEEFRRQLDEGLAIAAGSRQSSHANLFLRGDSPELLRAMIDEAVARLDGSPPDAFDLCFVHNFEHPDRPRLIELPPGTAARFRSGMRRIAAYIRDQLPKALDARPIRNRLQALVDRAESEMKRSCAKLEAKLKEHGLVLVREETGQLVRASVHVQQTGRVITQDDLANLVAKGQVSAEEFDTIRRVVRDLQPELREVTRKINQTWAHAQSLRYRLLNAETRRLVADLTQPLLQQFDEPEIKQHLESVLADVLDKRVDRDTAHLADPELLYGVNVVHEAAAAVRPVVHEHLPKLRNLAGTIDPSWLENRRSVASFHGIRGGSLMAASGGFLVISAEDLIRFDDGARALCNALVHGVLQIEPPSTGGASPAMLLRPDPIPVRAGVIVTGDHEQWRTLCAESPGFMALFDAPIDFPASVPRSDTGIAWLATRLHDHAAGFDGVEVSDEALAALVEHAARGAGGGRLSTRIDQSRILLDDAVTLTGLDAQTTVSAVHVHRAINRRRPPRHTTRNRRFEADRFPVRQYQPGQVHVCCHESHSRESYGQLVRIQAALAPAGRGRFLFEGLIRHDTELASLRIESALARLLHLDGPARIQAVISCTPADDTEVTDYETVALGGLVAVLGRLSGMPLRQDLSLIGAADADGRLTAVDGLNERIEDLWLSLAEGESRHPGGVVIPAVQRDDLMLRPEAIKAVRNELFQVLAARSLVQVIEALVGASPGQWNEGAFPADSMFARAREVASGRRPGDD